MAGVGTYQDPEELLEIRVLAYSKFVSISPPDDGLSARRKTGWLSRSCRINVAVPTWSWGRGKGWGVPRGREVMGLPLSHLSTHDLRAALLV